MNSRAQAVIYCNI